MKLKKYNKKNTQSSKSTHPFISFNQKGQIIINSRLHSLLNPNDHESISLEFLNDEDSPRDWYIKLTGQDGFCLRNKKESKYWVFNSSVLAKKIFSELKPPGYDKPTLRFLVKADPVNVEGESAYLIFTKPVEK